MAHPTTDRTVRRQISRSVYYVGPESELRDATNEELAEVLADMAQRGHVSRGIVEERIRWRAEGTEKNPTVKVVLDYLWRSGYAERFQDFARRRGVTILFDREGLKGATPFAYPEVELDKRKAIVAAIANRTIHE